jgi:nucleotide-binding universal stress UspA family protein
MDGWYRGLGYGEGRDGITRVLGRSAMYRRILVPVDGSAASGLAVDEALALARDCDAALRVAHVIEWPVPFADLGWSAELEYDAVRRAGESLLEDTVDRARRRGVRADSILLKGYGISRAIAEEGRRWPAELIVLGTHVRRGLARLLLGSVAEGVIRIAPVPVLVVRVARQTASLDRRVPSLASWAHRVRGDGHRPVVPPIAA